MDESTRRFLVCAWPASGTKEWPIAEFDEWWATDKADEIVFVDGNQRRTFRVKVTEIPLPPCTPAMVDAGEAPHPYGWQQAKEASS